MLGCTHLTSLMLTVMVLPLWCNVLTLLLAAAFSSAGVIADSSDDRNELLKGCTHVDLARELLNHLRGAPLRTALQTSSQAGLSSVLDFCCNAQRRSVGAEGLSQAAELRSPRSGLSQTW